MLNEFSNIWRMSVKIPQLQFFQTFKGADGPRIKALDYLQSAAAGAGAAPENQLMSCKWFFLHLHSSSLLLHLLCCLAPWRALRLHKISFSGSIHHEAFEPLWVGLISSPTTPFFSYRAWLRGQVALRPTPFCHSPQDLCHPEPKGGWGLLSHFKLFSHLPSVFSPLWDRLLFKTLQIRRRSFRYLVVVNKVNKEIPNVVLMDILHATFHW